MKRRKLSTYLTSSEKKEAAAKAAEAEAEADKENGTGGNRRRVHCCSLLSALFPSSSFDS
eukprot:2204527-Pleurochrysis_carterae.AAC.1